MRHSQILLTAALFALPAVARADGPDPAALFEKLDANHDQKLSKDEIPREQARFFERTVRVGDANGDGVLTREEFIAGFEKAEPAVTVQDQGPGFGRGAGARPPMDAEAFSRMDRNGDGKLHKDELPAFVRERMAPLFERSGRDSLTKEEFLRGQEGQRGYGGGRPMPQGGDRPAMTRDGDGPRGPEGDGPGPRGAMPRPAFLIVWDTDGNGMLSEAELKTAVSKIKDLDKNDDGQLDSRELMGFEPGQGPGRPDFGRMGDRGPGGPDGGRGPGGPDGGRGPGGQDGRRGPLAARPDGNRPEGDRPRPDGNRPPQGSRDGDHPRPEGARDGDGPPKGPRDGDRPEGGNPRDGQRGFGGPREGGPDGNRGPGGFGRSDSDRPMGQGRDDGPGPGRGGFGGPGGMPGPAFLRAWDTDSNGMLSESELKAAVSNFARLDTNGDGQLDVPELMGFRPGMRDGEGGPGRPGGFGGPPGGGRGGPGGPQDRGDRPPQDRPPPDAA